MSRCSRYPGDRSYLKDHPLMAGVEPEEPVYCEYCDHLLEHCTCIDDLKFEEEREEV